ncbi:MAG TPA: threonine/serine dehydratase [Candidatus Acidoferrales bacterium]|nr:threonine/serine dehydratase [Candidatus Acidoferrales bacterium]
MAARQYTGMDSRFRTTGRASTPAFGRQPADPPASGQQPAAQPAPASSSDRAEAEPLLVSLDTIRGAAEVLRGVVVRTPLLPFGPPLAGDPFGRTRTWLKPESLQPIGAFKLRGAYYNIATLSADRRAAGVVAHSSGNHAQGVARAARLLGVRAVIVMPSDAPRVKIERVRADGAEIVMVGPSSEERAQRAAELAERDGLAMVAPYDDSATIAGQGTIGLEIVQQLARIEAPDAPGRPADAPGAAGMRGTAPGGERGVSGEAGAHGETGVHGERPRRPFTVLVPVGGGGIASGVAVAVKSLRPDATVLGVEPELAADARDSLREGHIVTWPADRVAQTIADGQRTAHVGVIPFAHLRRYLDGILTVSEDEIARAMVRAAREARLVLEPSGATTLAAWLFHASELRGDGRIVCILSGGNVDPARYEELLARGVAAGG